MAESGNPHKSRSHLHTHIIIKLIHRSSRVNEFKKQRKQQRNCCTFLIDRSLHKNYDCNDNFFLFHCCFVCHRSVLGHVGIFYTFEGFIEITKQVELFMSLYSFNLRLFFFSFTGKKAILSAIELGKYFLKSPNTKQRQISIDFWQKSLLKNRGGFV